MTLPSYSYIPGFGVDPYAALGSTPADEFGGGANVTQQNLIASLWNLTSIPPLVNAGSLIKPLTSFPADYAVSLEPTGLFSGNEAGGSKPIFDSRTSARFFLSWDVSVASNGFIAFLNPPPEYSQRVLNSMKAVLDPTNPVGYLTTLKNGIGSIGAGWNSRYGLGSPFFLGETTPSNGSSVFGEPAPSPMLLPLVKTNGANGVFPEFYSSPIIIGSSPQDTVKDTNDLAAGAPFAIPFLFVPEDVEALNLITISWDHSTARVG